MASALARRAAYVAAVSALKDEAERLLAQGTSEEQVARLLVARRNGIKLQFRANDDPELVKLMEARNRAKYGDPVGPGPDWLFAKYGSWQQVIEAACRPANLRRL